MLDVLEDSLSNAVQLTGPRATLAESLPAQMDELMRLYVEPMRVPRPRARSGRAQIQATLRAEFERAGVWALMRKRIAAAAYTQPGDPLKLDCGYRALRGAERPVRIFQAVSLEGEVEAAKGLAWAAPRLREGVGLIEGAALELTAVVEPLRMVTGDRDEGEAFDRYRFGVDALERESIRVVTVADLARAAETARRELGL